MYEYIYGEYLTHHHVDAVLMGGRWTDAYFPQMEGVMNWMRQHRIRVILIGPGIEFDVPLPRLLALSIRAGKPSMLDAHRKIEPMGVDQRLALVARNQWKIPYISMYENLCDPKVAAISGCPAYAAPGVPLLFDSNHFTPAGSILYARSIRSRHQLP